MNNIGVLQCGEFAVVVATSETSPTSPVLNCLPLGVLGLESASDYRLPHGKVQPLDEYLKKATPEAATNSQKIEYFNSLNKTPLVSSFSVERSYLFVLAGVLGEVASKSVNGRDSLTFTESHQQKITSEFYNEKTLFFLRNKHFLCNGYNYEVIIRQTASICMELGQREAFTEAADLIKVVQENSTYSDARVGGDIITKVIENPYSNDDLVIGLLIALSDYKGLNKHLIQKNKTEMLSNKIISAINSVPCTCKTGIDGKYMGTENPSDPLPSSVKCEAVRAYVEIIKSLNDKYGKGNDTWCIKQAQVFYEAMQKAFFGSGIHPHETGVKAVHHSIIESFIVSPFYSKVLKGKNAHFEEMRKLFLGLSSFQLVLPEVFKEKLEKVVENHQQKQQVEKAKALEPNSLLRLSDKELKELQAALEKDGHEFSGENLKIRVANMINTFRKDGYSLEELSRPLFAARNAAQAAYPHAAIISFPGVPGTFYAHMKRLQKTYDNPLALVDDGLSPTYNFALEILSSDGLVHFSTSEFGPEGLSWGFTEYSFVNNRFKLTVNKWRDFLEGNLPLRYSKEPAPQQRQELRKIALLRVESTWETPALGPGMLAGLSSPAGFIIDHLRYLLKPTRGMYPSIKRIYEKYILLRSLNPNDYQKDLTDMVVFYARRHCQTEEDFRLFVQACNDEFPKLKNLEIAFPGVVVIPNAIRETSLFSAAAAGRLNKVCNLLREEDPKINALNSQLRTTALHVAAQNGHNDVVAALIKANADVNTTDPNGQTALHYCAATGSCDAAKALLDAEANKNAIDERGKTPLLIAAHAGKKGMLHLLYHTYRASLPSEEQLGKFEELFPGSGARKLIEGLQGQMTKSATG